MTDEFEYHNNKKPGKTYISKAIASATLAGAPGRRIRIASKVFDSPEAHSFAIEHQERVIRATSGGRQEIVAKFYEDSRGVFWLTIQKFTANSGKPHKISFSFSEGEITRLLEFINNLQLVQFPSDDKINLSDAELKKLLLSPVQVRRLIVENPELIAQFLRSEVTKSDIVAIGYRKKQLERFNRLLFDTDYFELEKKFSGQTGESLWQSFFEKNKWIFGYGLTHVFLSSLVDRKLEQVVFGSDFSESGNRADAIVKTRGAIEAICFVEIKKHTTDLLKTARYRSGCWPPSDELCGGVVQVQGTVEKAVRRLAEKIEPSNDDGDPTGEELFGYQPRSFLVIGSLTEFRSERGVNKEKYRSFELYRRNTSRPEILTFDELYARAQFIVEHAEQ